MASIKTFGKPMTLKAVKKKIDKLDGWENEITQIQKGKMTISANTRPYSYEVRGLNFKPDIVLIYGPVSPYNAGNERMLSSVGVKISSENKNHNTIGQNTDANSVLGTRYYDGSLKQFSDENGREIEYSDGFSLFYMVYSALEVTETTYIQWIAIKYDR